MLLIKDLWNWLTNQALNQLIAVVLICLVCFLLLLKYPIEFERTSYETKQNISITKTTKYIAHTFMSGKGAKLKLCTYTAYVEVRKEND